MVDIINDFLSNVQKGVGSAPMSEGACNDYAMAVMMESSEEQRVDLEELRKLNILSIEIILKRIEVLKLPIAFTPEGLLASYAMCENTPGRAVAILIDCLTSFESKTVTAGMLADLYPHGFYNEETFTKYVDNILKNPEVKNQIKWSNIY